MPAASDERSVEVTKTGRLTTGMRREDLDLILEGTGERVRELGPDPEPVGSERFCRLVRGQEDRARTAREPSVRSSARTVRGERAVRARPPVPACIGSEPALVSPYLTDGRRLLRIVSHTALGSEMIVLVEDCRTLISALETWRGLAGRVRAVQAARLDDSVLSRNG
jgi:hypothetical protein